MNVKRKPNPLTNTSIVGLMDYHLEIEKYDPMYDLGWINWNDWVISEINEFLDEWYNGKRRKQPAVFMIGEITLINSEALVENLGKEVHDFTGYRTPLDGLSFQDPDLVIPPEMTRFALGYIYCFMDQFFLQAETPEHGGLSESIYRSPKFSYWRINHLLRREEAV